MLRYLLPTIAGLLICFACWKASVSSQVENPSDQAQNVNQPIRIAAKHVVGVGIVEPPGQKIVVGFHQSGVIHHVAVRSGSEVCEGDLLVQLDSRAAEAEVASKEAEWQLAQKKRDRLRSLPRPEAVRLAERKLDVFKTTHQNALDQHRRVQLLTDTNMVSQEELQTRRYAEAKAAIEIQQSQAELDQVTIGATGEEKAIAEAEIVVAFSALQKARVALSLLTIVAPHDARVLRCDLHAGEFVDASRRDEAPLQLSPIGSLHVRTEFDEEEAARVPVDGVAYGMVRSRVANRLDLRLVRFEPIMQGKRNLMGHGTERVDTRVMHAIYEIVSCDAPVRPGQAIDVFVESQTEEEDHPQLAQNE
jgi:multidrug efflux pump subunit AcrA (membrane-fusion protein)